MGDFLEMYEGLPNDNGDNLRSVSFCDNEIDASWCDSPTCPHCGYEETDTYDMDHSDGAEAGMTCGSCGEDYEVMANVMIRWSSRKMDGDYP